MLKETTKQFALMCFRGCQLRRVLLAFLFFLCAPAFSQCPAGIPSAGNPACIPPDRSNSPYFQQGGSSAPEAIRPILADRWGAIAIDDGDKTVGIGVSEMMRSEQMAKKAALNDCRAKGGSKCVISLAYYNQCGVIVWGAAGYNSVGAETIEKAERRAMEGCAAVGGRCQVYYASCSFAERVR